jgi:hypothetical protein
MKDGGFEKMALGAVSEEYWRSQNVGWQQEFDELEVVVRASERALPCV